MLNAKYSILQGFIILLWMIFVVSVQHILTYEPVILSKLNILPSNASLTDHDDKRFILCIPFHCTELTLHYYTRLLSNLLILTSLPHSVFIVISNMGDTHCTIRTFHEDHILDLIANIFQQKAKIKIFLWKIDAAKIESENRNFLTDAIYDRYIGKEKYNINDIIVSMFDADDLIHPQKFELMKAYYSSLNINGSVLHSAQLSSCKFINIFHPDSVDISQLSKDEMFNFLVNKSFDIYRRYNATFNIDYIDNINDINDMNYNCSRIDSGMIDNTIQYKPLENDSDIINLYLYNYLNHKFNALICNGWVTTTLYNLFKHPFSLQHTRGQDQIFNYWTILHDFDFYVCSFKLGIYCQ